MHELTQNPNPGPTQTPLQVMDEIFAPGLEAMHGSAAIRQIRAHEARSAARGAP